MDVTELIRFAKAWDDLGAAIQEQVEDVLDKGDDAECNANAIKVAKRELRSFRDDEGCDELHAALDSWLQARESEEAEAE